MENFYKEDPILKRLLKSLLPPDFFHWADKELEDYGALCAGSIDIRAIHSDRDGAPKLINYDKMGNEASKVWLNEGYKKSVKETYRTGVVGYIHKEIPELGIKGNYGYSYALKYLLSQAEPGLACPVTLTKATAYLIDHYASEPLKSTYLPHVISTGEVELYEGATFLTERQGGSDVGANELKAVKAGDSYLITGEKYFASNAGVCGIAMVLGRLDGTPAGTKGLSLFLIPWEENRAQGRLRIRRLKDKLGVRAVPSGEVEFNKAIGYLVGKEDKGFSYMIEALNLSRVSNAVASVGIMRRALREAKNYAYRREAFGNRLTSYPMIQCTLSQMTAKQEIELQAIFEVIKRMDVVMGLETKDQASQRDKILFRLYVAIMKQETAEQAIRFAHEAIEIHGGNGYIEDFVTPRLLRDAQVLTVWEGTANILGLEVLRLIMKYEADQIFAGEMRRKLSDIKKKIVHPIATWIPLMERQIEDLLKKVEQVRELNSHLQTFYCKALAERMAILFESVIALESCAQGDERQEAISEIYLRSVWKQDEFQQNPVELAKFQEVIAL
ncbi:alkylation response protein AidB-like acyl-CoA dehydrogenase [Bacillus thermophilus]|uniref:Alkylation response protein AidB-like acyl-CoA dehydrogenase n=1 Tax=Siminovitchia thermophila TaxID=1245522 RepID=A0ABS2R539_9BACI|nr:acyl-CoA dehydrogenase family protein [Siminovitchia thermophila]MBM7713746.1 alkylation response protein AidB-like acyl-CoA dehydrogenase [Siminovitchia thermophila]ONK23622.1 isovaleryl-CoA dehydrogenase [Bacillus sp. VT-16-64]